MRTSPDPRAANGDGTDGVTGDAPQPRWEFVRLELRTPAEVTTCPTHAELWQLVDSLVGRQFVQDYSPVTVVVEVTETPSGAYAANVFEATRAGDAMPAGESPLRRHEHAASCGEAVKTAALTISLFALPLVPNEAADTPPLPGGELPDLGQDAVAPTPSATGVPERTQLKPPRAAAATPHQDGAWAPRLMTAASFAYGQSPGSGLGGVGELGIRRNAWSSSFGGSVHASTGKAIPRSEDSARVLGPTLELWAGGCWHPRGGRFRSCAHFGELWMFARGRRFARDLKERKATPWVGASLGYEHPLSESLTLGPGLVVKVPFQPIRFVVRGEPTPVWEMNVVSTQLMLQLTWCAKPERRQ